MKTKKLVKNTIALATAITLSNMALAGDFNCSKTSNRIAVCLGDPTIKNTAQEPIRHGDIGYGLIAKDIDYLVPKNTGGSEAAACCGAWTPGIVSYGHMSALDNTDPNYKPGTIGMYVDNVTIKGDSAVQQIAGILHYNSLNFNNGGLGHSDYIYADNVNIDVTNSNTSPVNTPYPWVYYRVFGVISEDEGRNKHTNVNIRGNSNITVNRKCREGQSCFSGEANAAGVLALSRQGNATINTERDVTISVTGDYSVGEVVHTQDGLLESKDPTGTLNNKASVFTDGIESHGLYVTNDSLLGDQSLLTNAGYVETLQKNAHGLMSKGYRVNNITNDGIVMVFGENAKGVYVTNQNRRTSLANTTTLNLEESSVIQGGYGAAAAGVYLNGLVGEKTINNKGYIDGINYKTITVTDDREGFLNLNNDGYINGYQHIQTGVTNIVNKASGVFNLEHFDLQGNKLTVESIFSKNNSANFYNYGSVQLTNSSHGTPTVGLYTGLANFYAYEGGTIDLTKSNPLNERLGVGENNEVGDIFTITNANQNTTYFSEGGVIKLNVDLTKADQPSAQANVADHLVLDNAVSINNKPTLIKVVATRSSLGQAKPTSGQGILLIEVKGRSDCNAFALQSPVRIGNRQYELKQSDKNWYLVSKP